MRLEEKRLVKSRLGDATPDRGGKAKRFYTVEAAGLKALRTALTGLQKATRAVGMAGIALSSPGE